jgi:hypothetical protein
LRDWLIEFGFSYFVFSAKFGSDVCFFQSFFRHAGVFVIHVEVLDGCGVDVDSDTVK